MISTLFITTMALFFPIAAPTAPVSYVCSVEDVHFVFERNNDNALAFFTTPDLPLIVLQTDDELYVAVTPDGTPVAAFNPDNGRGILLGEEASCVSLQQF